ncbi:MAG: hypothetical protein U1E17_09110 [Geminicoccaceae bacterium]
MRQVLWPIALLLLARLALAADPALCSEREGCWPCCSATRCRHSASASAARWQRRAAGDPLTALQAAALVAWLLLATQAIAMAARLLGPNGGAMA